MVKIAIMGHGVVGSGVAEVFFKNRESILRRANNTEIDIKYILDLREFPGLSYHHLFTKDFYTILNDPEIKVVAEVMGGINPAYDYVCQCLNHQKSVVTSNKELVATHGAELLRIARENHVCFLFEASVGGGIPIIRPLHQCLAANDITEVAGILNGTTNFILTKMFKEGMNFDDALALAQKLGYAERNPDDDINGGDACRKICILASLVYGKHIYPSAVHTEGITKITTPDVDYASAINCTIKLIGRCKRLENGKLSIRVTPALLSHENQLANVDGVYNAILVRGDAIGDVVFYGKGAGKLPTASAVIADIIDAVKHINGAKTIYWAPAEEGFVASEQDAVESRFIRLKSSYPAGTRNLIRQLFGDVRYVTLQTAPADECVFVLPPVSTGKLSSALDAICDDNTKLLSAIPILD